MRRLLPALLLLAASCTAPDPWKPGRVRAVASFSILGDLVRQVGGDDVDLRVLVSAGTDAHTFEPRPEDGKVVAEAQLVFRNGLGFEPWLDRLTASAGGKAKGVDVSEGLPRRMAGKEVDPHAWHDVKNAIAMVDRISAALEAEDPGRAANYRRRAADLKARLEKLDAWVVEQVATIPQERRLLVTTHDSLGYYAARYGFAVVGFSIPSVSTEGGEPAASDIATLVTNIRGLHVPAIFAEAAEGRRVMERVAAEAGVRLGEPLFTDTLGAPGGPAFNYEGLIRSNTRALVEGLK